MEHPFHLLLLDTVLSSTALDTGLGLVAINFLELVAAASHKRDDLGILTNISPELGELIFLSFYFCDFLDHFRHCRVKGLTFHHKSRCLEELDSSKENGYELGEFDA